MIVVLHAVLLWTSCTGCRGKSGEDSHKKHKAPAQGRGFRMEMYGR
nr:MAG TPA: conotoxin [Caudoviricetes sp.]